MTQNTNELLEPLLEWKEARQAIFNFKMKSTPDAEQLALWKRLADAESKLMEAANK